MNIIAKLLVSTALAASCFGAALAGPYEDGVAAYKAENYTRAHEIFLPLAKQGNAKAQVLLGSMYYLGTGVTQDYSQATHWHRKAAEQGYEFAQHTLGAMYYDGLGVTQNYLYAAKWFKKAAEQGNDGAQYQLGLLYKEGKGVNKDLSKAAYWFNKAAAQENIMAIVLYEETYTDALIDGVVLDDDPYRTPPPVPKATFEQGVQAIKAKEYGKAFQVLEPLAHAGNAKAQSLTGTMYANGMGRPVNVEMAIYWWKKAAAQENDQAQFNLGVAYAKGTGVQQSRTEAVKWIKKAQENNHPQAKVALKQLGIQ